ncbi:hypothetical protein SK128_023763, partial [Halocaridina rubra]
VYFCPYRTYMFRLYCFLFHVVIHLSFSYFTSSASPSHSNGEFLMPIKPEFYLQKH